MARPAPGDLVRAEFSGELLAAADRRRKGRMAGRGVHLAIAVAVAAAVLAVLAFGHGPAPRSGPRSTPATARGRPG